MTSIPIYGHLWSTEIRSLQYLASPVLDGMIFTDSYQDLLQCHDSVLFVRDYDADTLFDVTQQLVKQGNYLVFYNLFESDTTARAVSYGNLMRDFPDLEKFPFVNSGHKKTTHTFGLETFLFRLLTLYNQAEAHKIELNAQTHRPYQFLFLNGRHADHRSQLWSQLKHLGLLDQALCSYLGYQVAGTAANQPESALPVYLPQHYESQMVQAARDTLSSDAALAQHQTWLSGAWSDVWVGGQLTPINRYVDTYFSVITETSVGDDLFVTEKTFKALMAGHPFIVLGNPGIYQYIRDLGFKTYHGIIDESFDREPSWQARTQAIVREIKKLCDGNLDQFAAQCHGIGQHNRQNYAKLAQARYNQLQCEFSLWCEQLMTRAETYITTGNIS